MILLCNSEATPGVGTSARLLAQGAAGLDAIEAGIRCVESDEAVRSVGRGGWPNLLGEVELDAAMMDGTTLQAGAVGALKGYLHPISIARAVMERLPHVFLVGAGAARFAREIGAAAGDNLTADSAAAWQAWFAAEVPDEMRRHWPEVPLAALCRAAIDPEVGRDTTTFLALDRQGAIAGGVSTSGWRWKYPGRLGDSPVIGAGMYADSRHGACACTGAGEMTIRAGTARAVVLYMKLGMDVAAACREAVKDLARLAGGLIDRVTIHAIDPAANHHVIAVNGAGPRPYWVWHEGETAPRAAMAEFARLGS